MTDSRHFPRGEDEAECELCLRPHNARGHYGGGGACLHMPDGAETVGEGAARRLVCDLCQGVAAPPGGDLFDAYTDAVVAVGGDEAAAEAAAAAALRALDADADAHLWAWLLADRVVQVHGGRPFVWPDGSHCDGFFTPEGLIGDWWSQRMHWRLVVDIRARIGAAELVDADTAACDCGNPMPAHHARCADCAAKVVQDARA